MMIDRYLNNNFPIDSVKQKILKRVCQKNEGKSRLLFFILGFDSTDFTLLI